MQIEHEPHEGRWRVPHEARKEKEALRKRLGREPQPSDMLMIYGPIVVVMTGLFLWRNGWPI